MNKLEVAVYLRASDTNETSDGRFALYPLEHRADSEPGNTAGGPGLGAVSQLPDCQRAVRAGLLFIREQQEHGPGDTGADHGGAGRGTHFDKLRPFQLPYHRVLLT